MQLHTTCLVCGCGCGKLHLHRIASSHSSHPSPAKARLTQRSQWPQDETQGSQQLTIVCDRFSEKARGEWLDEGEVLDLKGGSARSALAHTRGAAQRGQIGEPPRAGLVGPVEVVLILRFRRSRVVAKSLGRLGVRVVLVEKDQQHVWIDQSVRRAGELGGGDRLRLWCPASLLRRCLRRHRRSGAIRSPPT